MAVLTQLLVAGRSLAGVRSAPLPYRPAQPGLLPRFSEEMPVLRTTTATSVPSVEDQDHLQLEWEALLMKPRFPVRPPTPEPAPRPSEGKARGASARAMKGLPVGQMLPPAPPPPRAAPRAAPTRAGSVALSRWLSRLNPFLLRPGRLQARTPAQLGAQLGRVRVMRNDLSDADLELVAARRSTRLDREAVRGRGGVSEEMALAAAVGGTEPAAAPEGALARPTESKTPDLT